MPDPIPFRSVLAIEGVETSDRRIIEPGALSWRDLPLSLMAIIEDSHGGMPTTTSVNVGRIDTITREAAADLGKGANRIIGTGVFDGADPVAADVARKVGEQYLRGISIDVGDVESELEVIAEDEDGWPTDWLDHLTAGRIGMATVCGFAAFEGATIELVEADAALAASAQSPEGLVVPQQRGDAWTLLASIAVPDAPPREWLLDPQLDGPTALTVDDSGRVYGHLALWGTEHVALPGVTPPRSPSGYSHFHVGSTRTAEGDDVPTGVLTLGTGHAPLRGLSPQAAAEHYDHTGSAWADVRAGEDAYGIWIAGAVRPGISDDTLRQARGSALSGDWRRIGGHFDLVAALSVNTPGFPIPRPAFTASAGEAYALVAAGAMPAARVPRSSGGSELAAVEAAVARMLKPLQPLVNAHRAEQARARMQTQR